MNDLPVKIIKAKYRYSIGIDTYSNGKSHAALVVMRIDSNDVIEIIQTSTWNKNQLLKKIKVLVYLAYMKYYRNATIIKGEITPKRRRK